MLKINTAEQDLMVSPLNLINGILLSYLRRRLFSKDVLHIINQHLARHFKNNSAGLFIPPPFLCSQIITPFSYLMLSANQERGLCF